MVIDEVSHLRTLEKLASVDVAVYAVLKGVSARASVVDSEIFTRACVHASQFAKVAAFTDLMRRIGPDIGRTRFVGSTGSRAFAQKARQGARAGVPVHSLGREPGSRNATDEAAVLMHWRAAIHALKRLVLDLRKEARRRPSRGVV